MHEKLEKKDPQIMSNKTRIVIHVAGSVTIQFDRFNLNEIKKNMHFYHLSVPISQFRKLHFRILILHLSNYQ